MRIFLLLLLSYQTVLPMGYTTNSPDLQFSSDLILPHVPLMHAKPQDTTDDQNPILSHHAFAEETVVLDSGSCLWPDLPTIFQNRVSERKESLKENICLHCFNSFESIAELGEHLDHKHNAYDIPDLFACKVAGCNKKYTTKKSLGVHAARVHGPRRYECPKCLKSYAFKCDLMQHIKRKKHFFG